MFESIINKVDQVDTIPEVKRTLWLKFKVKCALKNQSIDKRLTELIQKDVKGLRVSDGETKIEPIKTVLKEGE
jgi:hypothetical protein